MSACVLPHYTSMSTTSRLGSICREMYLEWLDYPSVKNAPNIISKNVVSAVRVVMAAGIVPADLHVQYNQRLVPNFLLSIEAS